METKETHISPWLHSIQYTALTPGRDLFYYNSSVRSTTVLRIMNTKEKINSILDTLYGLEEKLGVPIGPYQERIRDMVAIRDAIGVYTIFRPDPDTEERQRNILWQRYELDSERTRPASGFAPKKYRLDPHNDVREWLDYLGKDDVITEEGGWVVVSLSDSGILYLNSIREGVSSLYDSYTNTTVTA
jgi:hypothetical protein